MLYKDEKHKRSEVAHQNKIAAGVDSSLDNSRNQGKAYRHKIDKLKIKNIGNRLNRDNSKWYLTVDMDQLSAISNKHNNQILK